MLEILILFLGGTVVGGNAIARRQRLQAWKNLAAACGLEVVKAYNHKLIRSKLEARDGPVTVRIESTARTQGYSIRVLATFPRPPGLFSSFKIRRHSPGLHDPEVGEELFDRRFSVEGSSRLITALLDAETRRLLLGVNFEAELEISGAELRLVTFDRNLWELLPLLLALIRRFSEPVDIVQRLARNARQDPAAGVRLRSLFALVRDFPGDSSTLEALGAACSDPSPEVRLRAARALGAEGRDVLFALAEGLEDDAVSAEAVTVLAGELPFERTKAILDQASDKLFPKTVQACLEALGEKGASPGQLSMAETDAGQLSLAPEPGQLSLATDPGQLSLSSTETGRKPGREGAA
jgi:hypothetical protein